MLIKLTEKDHGKEKVLMEGYLHDIVRYLKNNDKIYTWILNEDPNAKTPNFNNIETLRDLKYELKKINLGWWSLEVEEVENMSIKIEMTWKEYNKMMDFTKQFVAKPGGPRPIYEYIKLTIKGDVAKAEALDGYKTGYIMLDLNDSEGDGEILIPLTTKLKKSDAFAVITDMGEEIEIKTATRRSAYRKPEGEFLDTSKFYPDDEPSEIFAFNPILLSDALRAFKNEKAVKIEYRGALKPLIIKGSTAQALVLPVRLRE